VWTTSDAGARWSRLDEGMPAIVATGVGYTQGVLFAATNEGLYRCATGACSAGSPVRTTKIVEYRNALSNHYFIAEEGARSGLDSRIALDPDRRVAVDYVLGLGRTRRCRRRGGGPKASSSARRTDSMRR
jgi:hypothetical protein